MDGSSCPLLCYRLFLFCYNRIMFVNHTPKIDRVTLSKTVVNSTPQTKPFFSLLSPSNYTFAIEYFFSPRFV